MTDTATTCPFLVPPGGPLIEGMLYLGLSHGRKDPAQEMEGWGFAGPTFGPLDHVGQTYLCEFCLHASGGQELWLRCHNDLIVWDGSYYGHFTIFIAGRHDRG
jgi:hypothetical protein